MSIHSFLKRFIGNKSTTSSKPKMSNDRYFGNLFEDYSADNAHELIHNKQINPNSKILATIDNKWKDTLEKFKYLDFNDNSVYTGTSGIALLKMKKDPHNPEILKEALQLLSLSKLRDKRHTFLCGDIGPLAIGAVVYHKLKLEKECMGLCTRISNMKRAVLDIKSDLPNEYLYGRAGYLYGVLYVNQNVSPKPFDDNFIRDIVLAIISCGRAEAKSEKFGCPLMYHWHDSYYLGAAHGLAGILYLLLVAKFYLSEDELINFIKPTIDYLVTLSFPSGNFPSSLGKEADKLVQWCHGAPGFLYLFTTAYKVFKEPKYLQLAEKCGDVIWARGLLRKGYSICHGVAGNGYCFLELFQTTENEKHLYRALRFAEWCLDYTKLHEEYSPDRPLSLFEGIAGPMYFLLDILKPMEAKFPGFAL